MKVFAASLITVIGLVWGIQAQDLSNRARQMEMNGDGPGARALLMQAANSTPPNPEALKAYAEFLDRHRDPTAAGLYERLLTVEEGRERAEVARRLLLIDARNGDWNAAQKHMEIFRTAGGTGLTLPNSASADAKKPIVLVPGPIRSFNRMAALSPDLNPDDLLGALARNVVTNGYQAASSNEALEQTEYLKLVVRYLSQARELDKLAGAQKVIKIETCDSAQTGDLLRVLGYRMRGGCGSDVVLETVNATRAFLTIDSGFPAGRAGTVAAHQPAVHLRLQAHRGAGALRAGILDFRAREQAERRVHRLLSSAILPFAACTWACRSWIPPTADELRKAVPAQRSRAFAHVLDFYGGMFEIRNGKAVVPGGARSEKAWAELVGVSPEKGAAFFESLVAEGRWLAGKLFRFALPHRLDIPRMARCRNYLTEPERLKRFYAAIRGQGDQPRSGPSGVPRQHRHDAADHAPAAGSRMASRTSRAASNVWRELFTNHPHGKYDAKLTKAAAGWKDPRRCARSAVRAYAANRSRTSR